MIKRSQNLNLKKKVFIGHKSDVIFFKITLYEKNILLTNIADLFLKVPFPKDHRMQKNGPIDEKHVCII